MIITDITAQDRSLLRAAAGVDSRERGISYSADGRGAPRETGERGYWVSPGGAIVSHPQAYQRAYGRCSYVASTRTVAASAEWLDAARRTALPAGSASADVLRLVGRTLDRMRRRSAHYRSVAVVLDRTPVVTRLDLARCPLCAVRVSGLSLSGVAPILAHTCGSCGVWAHSECSAELLHRCGVYGCRGDLVPAAWISTSEAPIDVARREAARE